MTIEEMRQRRKMSELFGSKDESSAKSFSDLMGSAEDVFGEGADTTKAKKRFSFSGLVDTPPPPSSSSSAAVSSSTVTPAVSSKKNRKRMSFSDLVGGDANPPKETTSDEDFVFFEAEVEANEDNDEDETDEAENDADEQKKASGTRIIRVKVPPGAKPGQIVQVRDGVRMFNVSVPADAAKRGFGTFPVEVAHENTHSSRAKFLHGIALYRTGRLLKSWRSIYVSYTHDGFLTLFGSREDFLRNRNIIDQVRIHGFMQVGKIYLKEDSGRSKLGNVWQMKILENDVQANREKIKVMKLWKLDDRLDVRERIKLGAFNGVEGKGFLENLQEHMTKRIMRLQKANLANTQTKLRF